MALPTASSSVMPSPIVPVALPVLDGSNYSDWKEKLLLSLGCADLDLALRVDKPAAPTDASTANEIAHSEKWQRSNRLSLMFIKSQIAKNIRSSIPDSETAKGYLTSIEQQFVSSDKALASTLMAKLSSLKHSGGSIREHIMEMRDIASQLKGLECTFSDSFLVHYILNSLPPQYGPFKISYNTHKDKWSINELLTMCVQEEGRLAQERQNIVHTVDTVSHTEGKYKKRTWNNSFKGKSGPMWKKAKDAPAGPNQTRENGVTCFFCKKAGHVKKDCHKYQKWLEKKGISGHEKAKSG